MRILFKIIVIFFILFASTILKEILMYQGFPPITDIIITFASVTAIISVILYKKKKVNLEFDKSITIAKDNK